MHVRISTPGLLQFRAKLKKIGTEGLGRALAKELGAAAKPLHAHISREAASTLPKRGGYNTVMSRSVRARTAIRPNRLSALVSIVVYSAGKAERRDINRVDDGVLRHPVYGRSRRIRRGIRAGTHIANPWATTKVRPEFATRAIRRLGPAISEHAVNVVEDFMDKLKG